jgi:O-glycosyl hydrolase
MATVVPTPVRTMQGFGASGAWWPISVVQFAAQVQQRLADMLFAPAPAGIQLSVYRYNVGGGGLGVNDPSRAPQTFLVRPGIYDWSRDAAGRTFLDLANRHRVPILVGFVNSAPGAWTTNGLNQGGSLTPGAESAYARYLADVVSHLDRAEGIRLSHVSPMNEPDSSFAGSSQEGMAVPVEQRRTLVQAVAAELRAEAPFCRVIADESSRVGDQFLPEVSRWLDGGDTTHDLAALAHHLYDFPDDATLRRARQLGESAGLPTWMTEICCVDTSTSGYGQGYDPTIANAILMATLIWQSLTQADDAAFHWWVAASSAIGVDPSRDPGAALRPNPHGWNDGLVYYDANFAANGNQALYPTKRYYALGNFSRYVRPGARRHDVEGVPDPLRVLAFSAESGWTVVAINPAPEQAEPTPLELQLPVEAGAEMAPLESVQTSAEHSLDPVAPPTVVRGWLRAVLPAQSVTTFVLRSSTDTSTQSGPGRPGS